MRVAHLRAPRLRESKDLKYCSVASFVQHDERHVGVCESAGDGGATIASGAISA
jgi:hypothetical protein